LDIVGKKITIQFKEEKLKEFEKISSWNMAEFIEKGGWVKCPGKKRLTMLYPEHAPMGLNFLSKNEFGC